MDPLRLKMGNNEILGGHLGGPMATHISVSMTYNIACQPQASVVSMLSSEALNISFRRTLLDEKLQELLHLVAKTTNINLDEGRDHDEWNLHKYKMFTVRSMYLHKIRQHAPYGHELIWKHIIPLMIKVFF